MSTSQDKDLKSIPTTNDNKQNSMPLGIFCTKEQGAMLLGVSRATFDRCRKRSDFPKARIISDGHLVRFKTAELIEWLDSRQEEASA